MTTNEHKELPESIKKITFLIIILLLSTHFLNASCLDDGKIWSERIFTGNHNSAIFTCKVLEFSSEEVRETIDGVTYLKTGIISSRAVVQVDKVFFGKIDTTIVNLNAGFFMELGESYLIYGYGYKNNFAFAGRCLAHSKKVTNNKDVVRELEILSELSNIINNKQTCSYTMLDANNNKLAEGFYKNGKPAKIWKHYWPNGNIKTKYNFKDNIEIQYHDNGLTKFKRFTSEKESIYYRYSTKNNNFLTYKEIVKSTDYGKLETLFFYYENGNLQKQYTRKSLGNNNHGYSGDGYMMDYQEYYENGKIKEKGNLYNKDRVGTWYFYNEKGKNTDKKVYEDVDTTILLAIEKKHIEQNKQYNQEKSFMYGKITEKNTGKGIKEARISLSRDGYLDYALFADTWDDGSII